jgi:ABC-2 type transport system permease protein
MCLEKLRTNLVRKSDKDIFLRLPIKQSTLFLSKFAALLLWNYVTAFFLIVPINAIFFVVLKPGIEFWIRTAIVYLLLPLTSFLIATVLIIPYVSVINFVSRRYFIAFISVSALVIGAFFIYSKFLSALQNLFETESVKSLFSSAFVEILQMFARFAYPANALANIVFGEKMLESLIISGAIALASLIIAFASTRALYRLTLYKNPPHVKRGRRRFIKKRSVRGGLMHKEFITVFREPKHMFSYFSIALAMPFMVYCCYTLFDTLLYNAFRLKFGFGLALMVILVFTILTNTFCATNITRDGISALKAKIYPIKASKILSAKVNFCFIISSLSVIASAAVLYFVTKLELSDVLMAAGISIIFSLSQILLATKMDLKHAVLTASAEEIAKSSNRTIAKVITVGLFFALLIGIVTLFISLFVGKTPSFLGGFEIKQSYRQLAPLTIAGVYFIFSWIYYSVGTEKAFHKLVR